MLRDGLWKDFIETNYLFIHEIIQYKRIIILKNGRYLVGRSLDRPDTRRGVKYCGALIDEAAYCTKESKDILLARCLKYKGPLALATTPKGMNWIKDLIDESRTNPNIFWVKAKTTENIYLDPKQIELIRSQYDEKFAKQELDAEFVIFTGAVYYNFTTDNIIKCKHFLDSEEIIHIGIDFNINPMTATVMIIKDKIIYVVDEIVLPVSNTNQMCEEILKRYPTKRIITYPDPAGKAGSTKSAGKSDFDIIKHYGLEIKAKARAPFVIDRINAFCAMIKNNNEFKRFYVDEQCKHMIQSLEQTIYREGTREINKAMQKEHITDAAGYMIDYNYPIKQFKSEVWL